MTSAISVSHLNKTYASGFHALKDINLEIRRGEIFALLGPNGAGKTTLISIICGIVKASSGRVLVDGHDIVTRIPRDPLADRPRAAGTGQRHVHLGVVDRVVQPRPVRQAGHPAYIQKVLKDLSLWEKKDAKIATLSGGMKRRVMIAKALSHEPQILFLDEPTAGVDVELRKDMWDMVRALRASGVTIILTTHYIEEAEQMADRVGVINRGEIDPGREQRRADAQARQKADDAGAAHAARGGAAGARQIIRSTLADDGCKLIYTYDTQSEHTGITDLLDAAAQRRRALQRPRDHADFARGHFRQPGEERRMNLYAVARFIGWRWRAPSAPGCKASSRR